MSNDAGGIMGTDEELEGLDLSGGAGGALFQRPDKKRSTAKNAPSAKPKTNDEAKPKSEKLKTGAPKSTNSKKSTHINEGRNSSSLQRIPVDKIQPWKLADRPEDEFGDMDDLIASIKADGQTVPGLVRPATKGNGYELIYGRRRWEACRELGIDFWAIVKPLSDQEAFVAQANENMRRNNLSGWARCLSYRKAIDQGLFKDIAALARGLGVPREQVSNVMIYERLPEPIRLKVGDWQHVGIQTAKAIQSLWGKPENEHTLLEASEGIRSGKYGPAKLKRLCQIQGAEEKREVTAERVRGSSGAEYFSISRGAKGELNISVLQAGKNLMDTKEIRDALLRIFEERAKEKA